MVGAQPLEVGAAHIAIYKEKGAIQSGTDRALTFSGNAPSSSLPALSW